jgi:acetyl-CoA acetyltransferase
VIGARNPVKDQLAIANAATTGFTPHNTDRSALSYAVEACVAVLRDTGLGPADVDGIVGSNPSVAAVQDALGIPEVTWHVNVPIPFVTQVGVAMGAVAAGLADVVLAYHAPHRSPIFTASALRDPFRRGGPGAAGGGGGALSGPGPDSIAGAVGYTAWASRYIHEFGAKREWFGLVAVNDRTNARHNPAAALRDPITMDDYLAARMIREPMCLLDMDVPVDGADAFIITTAERARDMPHRPVLIHAATLGMIDRNV